MTSPSSPVLPQNNHTSKQPVMPLTVLWRGRSMEPTDRDSIVFNFFLNFPMDIFIRHVAPFFTAKEAWFARHISKDFADLFSDSTLWCKYYSACGLNAPIQSSSAENKTLSRAFVNDVPLWVDLKTSELESAIEKGQHVAFSKKCFSRSIYIAILTNPEFAVLHDHVIARLKKFYTISNRQSLVNLMLKVVTEEYPSVTFGAKALAIRFLAKHVHEQEVREGLLSIINPGLNTSYGKRLMSEAVSGLLPLIAQQEILNEIRYCLQKFGPYAIKPAADILITTPEFLNAIIDSLTYETEIFMEGYLHNDVIVNLLLERLSHEGKADKILRLMRILEPIYHLKAVQQAFCQKLLNPLFQSDFAAPIRYLIESTVLDSKLVDREVKREYHQQISTLQKHDVIFTQNIHDPFQKQYLLEMLAGSNHFERISAGRVLVPLVSHDPVVQNTVLQVIKNETYPEVFSALAPAAHLKNIRSALIDRANREKSLSFASNPYIDIPKLQLAIINALCPFIHEPEVRLAFLDWLETDGSPKVKCALLDALAAQLDQEDVLVLFLKAARNALPRHAFLFGDAYQLAAIDKLGAVVGQSRVQQTLLEVFKISSGPVKSACIRTLCRNAQIRLIKLEDLLFGCIDLEMQSEALQALITWIRA